MGRACRTLIAALSLATAVPAAAQSVADSGRATFRAYLDCRDGCDRDFLVTELTWVDWTRERLDADFHLLVVSIATGAGGRRYDVVAVGQRRHAGRADTITFVTEPNDSNDAVRRQLLRAIGQLLVAPASDGPLGRYLTVAYAPPPSARPARDRWDFWVFRASAQGSYNENSRSRSRNLVGRLDADRTTPQWKVRTGFDLSHAESRINVSGLGAFVSSQRLWLGDALVARSLGAHWSVGAGGSVVGSALVNIEQATRLAGVVEWDLFPYDEFQRRRLTVLYTAGARASRYADRTWYGKDAETRPLHSLDATFNTRQLWGDVRLSVQGEQDLGELDSYRAGVNGRADLNFGRHVSLSLEGGASRDRSQRSQPRGILSDDQILRLQAIQFREYRVFAQVGLTYRFGAIYNAIVNPRFESLQLSAF